MSANELQSLLRAVPGVDRVLEIPEVQRLGESLPRPLLVDAVRIALEQLRSEIRAGRPVGPRREDAAWPMSWIVPRVEDELARRLSPSLRPVINATGVVLHTNLGRAPLAARAMQRVATLTAGYSNLEYDLDARERGSRHVHVERLLRDLLGVESALVVNNCAAAVLLVLTALAKGREVIVSRGELVEIGGSFRIPDVMEQSGATLREVGTTNRTKLRDYEGAIRPETALLLKAHRSNFAIVGFTEEVDGADLAALGRQRGIPTAYDLGTGLLVDLAPFGVQGAETVQSELAKGMDLVMFSGDKLLGGPQAGVIVGRKALVERLRSHPLTRALRVDKTTIAALEATLLCYVDGSALREVPALAMLTATVEALGARCDAIIRQLRAADASTPWSATVAPAVGRVGGGTLPLVELPTRVVRLRHPTIPVEAIEARLRAATPAVVGRILEDALVLDARTIRDEDVGPLVAAVMGAAASLES